jgi:hypothetical protein
VRGGARSLVWLLWMWRVWGRSVLVLVVVVVFEYEVVVEYCVKGLEMVFVRSLGVLMVLMVLGLCECILAAMMPKAVVVALSVRLPLLIIPHSL